MDFETIHARMRKEYHSESRQLQVMSTLETLKLTKFMQERDITSVAEGLTKLVDYIERLTPQCPQGFQEDSHKARYLRSAVINFSWARAPVSNIVSNRYTFHAL